MNLLDFMVIEVLSEPYYNNYYWCVDVMADAYGRLSKMTVNVKTEKEAKEIQPGYVFQG